MCNIITTIYFPTRGRGGEGHLCVFLKYFCALHVMSAQLYETQYKIFTYVRMHICACVAHACVHVHIYAPICTNTYVHIRTYLHIRTYIYIYIYIYSIYDFCLGGSERDPYLLYMFVYVLAQSRADGPGVAGCVGIALVGFGTALECRGLASMQRQLDSCSVERAIAARASSVAVKASSPNNKRNSNRTGDLDSRSCDLDSRSRDLDSIPSGSIYVRTCAYVIFNSKQAPTVNDQALPLPRDGCMRRRRGDPIMHMGDLVFKFAI